MSHVCEISGKPATHRITCGKEVLYGAGDDNVIALAGRFVQKGKTPMVEPLVAPEPKPIDKVDAQVEAAKVSAGNREVKRENVERAMKDEQKLDDAGFPKPDTFFAVGTPLASVGVENFSRERQEFDKLPYLVDGIAELVKKINAEDRFDLIVPVRALVATDEYKLKVPGYGDFLFCNVDTLQALLDQTPVGMSCAKYLARCPADKRADHINWWLQEAAADKVCKLRLRKGLAGNEVFAVRTKGYTSYDAHTAAEIFADECPKDARVEIIYDQQRARARIQALFHTDIDPKDGVVGEVFKVGSALNTDDTGGGSLSGRANAWRALCLNFTNMMVSADIWRRKHMGKEVIIRKAVAGFIQNTFKRVDPFVTAWRAARIDKIIESAVPLEAEDEPLDVKDVYNSMFNIFAGITQRELVPVRGRKADRVQELMSAWEREPEPTRVGVVNAYTRFAHDSYQASPWDEDDIQDKATDLLYSDKPLPYTSAARMIIGS